MAQTQMKAKELTGFNIYQSKNQTIYWDSFSKTAYIITSSDVSKFSTWQLRFPLSLMLSLVLMLAGASYGLCLIVAVVAYIVSSIIFKFKYLPTLAVSLRWQKPKSEGFIKDTAKKFKFSSLLIMTIMFGVFTLLFAFDLFLYRAIDGAYQSYIILTTISLIGTIVTGLITITRKKIDKQ